MNNPSPATASICVSLEWAKKLKEVGWEQDSHFYWCFCFQREWIGSGKERCIVTSNEKEWKVTDSSTAGTHQFAAPTAEEILRRLPVRIDNGSRWLHAAPFENGTFWVGYIDKDGNTPPPSAGKDTLANVAAALYCYLAENKLLPAA